MKKFMISAMRFVSIASVGLFIGSLPVFAVDKPVVPSSAEMFGWVKEIVEITDRYPEFRRSGTAGDRAVRAYIIDTLKSFDIADVEEQTFDIQYQHYEKWELVVDGEIIPSYFLRGAEYSPEAGVDAELLYVGESISVDMDVNGKIVVIDLRASTIPGVIATSPFFADFVHDPLGTTAKGTIGGKGGYQPRNFPVSYYQAAKQGAVAMVAILKDYETGTDGFYPDSTSFVRARIPGLYLGKYAGEALVEKLKSSDSPLRAKLTLHGELRDATSANIVATVPAATRKWAGQKTETILVVTHHDAGWSGAVQDGSGIAAVLGLAKYYAQVPADWRDKNLVFVFDGSHYDWNYPMGANEFAEQNPEVMDTVVMAVGIEHFAKKFKATQDGYVDTGELEPRFLFVPQNKMLFDIAQEAIVKNNLHDIIIPNKKRLPISGETYSYFHRGIPVFGYISGPEYLFLSDDTLDKVAWEQFQPVVKTFIQILDLAMGIPGRLISRIDR